MATIRMSSLGEDGEGIPDVLEDDDHVKGGGAEGKDTVNNGRQQEGGQGEGVVQSSLVSSSPSQSAVDQFMERFSSLGLQEQHQATVVLMLTLAQQVGRMPQFPSAIWFSLPFILRFHTKAWSMSTSYSNSYQKMTPDDKLQTVSLMLSSVVEQLKMVSSRALSGPSSGDPSAIPLCVMEQDQVGSHGSPPGVAEYFEKTLVEFAQELDSGGGGERAREKVVKEMVGVYKGACNLLGSLCLVFSQREDPEVASAVQLVGEKYAASGEEDHTSLSMDLPELVRRFHCSPTLYSHAHQLSHAHWDLLSSVVSLKSLMLVMDPAAKQTLTQFIGKNTTRQLSFLQTPPHSAPKDQVDHLTAATCSVLTEMLVTASSPIVPRIDQSDFNPSHMTSTGAVADGHVMRYLSPVLFTCQKGMVTTVMKGTVELDPSVQ